jgi:hypothetical protein
LAADVAVEETHDCGEFGAGGEDFKKQDGKLRG